MVVIKKKLIKLEEFLEKNPKIKKKFNKEFKKYENRPKPNKKLKIGLKYIKKNFNLNLFLKQIEKYNYKYMDEGDMLDRVIQYGFKQDEVYKIRDHFDNKEYDKLRKLADDYKLLVKITDNFKAIDYMAEKVKTETLSKWIEATLLYSQINFTYYLFIDEINFTEQNRGNCLYFKSKNKKLIINKMIKFFDKLKKKYNQGGVMKKKKFDIDIFFNILSKTDHKNLVKQMPILDSSETLFSYALAKGYGFNKKGLWYDFLYDVDDGEPYDLTKKFKNIDQKLIYKPLVKIKGGDEDWNAFFEMGILSAKKNNFSFMVYNDYNSYYTERPKIVKIYKDNKIPSFVEIKKYINKTIKKVNLGPSKLKISKLGIWKKNIYINKY